MTEKTIRFGQFAFTPTPRGVEVARDLNATQMEIIGTWPWAVFERIIAAKPKES